MSDYLRHRDTTNKVQLHLSMDATLKEAIQKLANKNKLSLTETINRCLCFSLDAHKKEN
jgi:hypothetical protein